MINDREDRVIDKLFQSLLSTYKIGLETIMKGNSFIYDHVHLFHYKCHKINLNCGGSYIDFLIE